jgi:LEA14-like dessication related protein
LPVRILGLNGDFYLNDRYIANLSELQEINVPAFAEVTFPVKVQTNIFDIIQNIDLITKKQSGYTAKANLNINISNNIIPFTIERKF